MGGREGGRERGREDGREREVRVLGWWLSPLPLLQQRAS